MAADGSIVISTELDNKKAQAELNRLAKNIEGFKTRIKSLEDAQAPLIARAEELRGQLSLASDEAKRYGEEWRAGVVGADKQQSEAQAKVAQINSEYQKVLGSVEKYDAKIAETTSKMDGATERAGELSAQLGGAGESGSAAGDKISAAAEQVTKRLDKLGKRIGGLFRRVFFFSLITQGLRGLSSYFMDLIKSNDEASAALGRLKGAFLTLIQPIASFVIPILVKFLDLLTRIVSAIASFVAKLFGTTAQDAAAAAENLYDEQKAIKGVGSAAKKASGQLASFDQINKLEDNSSAGGGSGSSGITPIFNQDWLGSALDGVAEKITAALLLGGIALIAIGAATGNLGLVLSGLLLIGAGISYGEDTGVLEDWAQKLGLDRAEEFVTAALLIAGIAAVVIGIATGNIFLFLAGAAMIGAGIVYGDKNEVFSGWADKLGIDNVESKLTAALLIVGIAAVVIGIVTGNILLFLAGAGLVGAGIAYGNEKGVFNSWADKLGLDSVFDYVVTAIQLVGIALVAIGAAMGNIGMVIAGGIILAVGIAADAIGEERIQEWWEVLKLTRVQQWVGVVMMLAGIALVAIGAAMANILMILGGMALIGVATVTNTAEGNLKDWVTTLGLEKVVGWVTGALLLGGIALLVIGIVTANIPMVLAGLALLGAGISVGITSGTFESWLSTISGAFSGFKDTIVNTFSQLWDGVKGFINAILGGVESLANGVVRGINKVIDAINSINFTIPDWIPAFGGKNIGFNLRRLNEISIPRLATGAVIPPNREFLAVLGDQKSGTNVEAPLDTIVQAFQQAGGGNTAEAIYQMGNLILAAIRDQKLETYLDGKLVSRELHSNMQAVTKNHGRTFVRG